MPPSTPDSARQCALKYAAWHVAAYGAPAPETEVLEQLHAAGLSDELAQETLLRLVEAGELRLQRNAFTEGYVPRQE